MADLPVICIFGASGVSLQSEEGPKFETRAMDCRCYADDKKLDEVLAKDRPTVIASVGDITAFSNLSSSSFMVRKRWVHFKDVEELVSKGHAMFVVFMLSVLEERKELPLVSVFTPAYKTGDRIMRPWSSLRAQTYKDWEWVILDDSCDGGETWDRLSELARRDSRVRVYRANRHSGRIGEVKRDACALARGKFLVELDHDDEMVPDALEQVVNAFNEHPDVGFVYTDCAECFEDGTPVEYPPGWGMGYGSYRNEVIGGVSYKVLKSPNINPKTIRHIVAAPNHIRAWRKDLYDRIGGHRDMMHVADDYELMVRTFLATRMCRIPRMCYVQYRNAEGNTSVGPGSRNAEIQRLVRYVSMYYDSAIHERFVELGVDDFVWKNGETTFWRLMSVPNPAVEPHCTITFE